MIGNVPENINIKKQLINKFKGKSEFNTNTNTDKNNL